MTTTIRLNDTERANLAELAAFNGVKLSTLIKQKALESYEDWVDYKDAEKARHRYEKHPESLLSLDELIAELNYAR